MSKILIITLFALAAAITFSISGTTDRFVTTGMEYHIETPNMTEYDVVKAIASYLHLNYQDAFYSLYWREEYSILYGFISTGDEYVNSIYVDDKIRRIVEGEDDFCDWFSDYIDNVIEIAGVNSSNDDVTKVKKIANFIIDDYAYNSNRCQAIHASSGLGYMDIMRTYHYTFCMTDAMLMCACCDRMGIECKYVEGSTDGVTSHAWNSVYVNGGWQYVDISYARANSKSRDGYILFWANRIIYFEA